MKCELEVNSYVVFNVESCGRNSYVDYYEKTFPEGKLFIFMGEIKQCPGHCLLLDLSTGLILGMYHTCNFREATENEC